MKSPTVVSSTPYNSLTSISYQINPLCLRCNNYGNADYDIRNSFNASVRVADTVEVRQQVRQRRLWWLDPVAELLRPLRSASDGAGQHSSIGNYNGNTPYFPAQVIGAGQGSCNQYGAGLPGRRGFSSANT